MRIADQGIGVDLELFGEGSTGQTIETTGASLIGEGATGLTLEWLWTIWVQSTGATVSPGASIAIALQFNDASVDAAFGTFPPDLSHPVEAQMAMPEWTSWDPALFYLSAPRLVVDVGNSFGVNMSLTVDELALVTGSESTYLQGPAVSAFPVIAGSQSMGDTAWTQHVLDNDGVNPSMSSILDLAPDSLRIIGEVGSVPINEGNQFATSSDVLKCGGRLEIPLAGWASGVRWSDTIAAPISEELQAASRLR